MPNSILKKIRKFRSLYLLLLPFLIWGMLTPNGIRAAIVNNAWSIDFITRFFDPTEETKKLSAPPHTHPHADQFLSQLALQQGDEAIEDILMTDLDKPQNPLELDAYANLLYKDGKYEQAIEIWQEAENKAALEDAAITFQNQNKPGLILFTYQKAYELDPERYTPHLAKALENVDDYPSAITLLQQSIHDFPESENVAIWYHYLGDAYRDLGDYTQAEASYRQAVAVDPTYKRSWRNLGLMFRNYIKDFEQAAVCFKEYIKVDPQDVSGYLYLAETYEQSGLSQEALDIYQEALKLDPENEQAHQAISRLLQMNDE